MWRRVPIGGQPRSISMAGEIDHPATTRRQVKNAFVDPSRTILIWIKVAKVAAP